MRSYLPERSDQPGVIEFLVENLLLLPFLFPAYLLLEWVETHAGDALERKLGRVSHFGPLFGAVAGVVPQCGFSAAAASLYAGGVITAGTLIAVFLSTSDELVPILLAEQGVPKAFLVKLVMLKVLFAVVAGFTVNAILYAAGRRGPSLHVGELCAHSHCSCAKRKGIVVPALIHTVEIFVFLLAVSAVLHLALEHFGGEEALKGFVLNRPIAGELVAGLLGLVPNCAVSATCAKLYAAGGMSAGALVASSLTGAGVGLLVLFRTHRHQLQNLGILGAVYVFGVVFGHIAGFVL